MLKKRLLFCFLLCFVSVSFAKQKSVYIYNKKNLKKFILKNHKLAYKIIKGKFFTKTNNFLLLTQNKEQGNLQGLVFISVNRKQKIYNQFKLAIPSHISGLIEVDAVMYKNLDEKPGKELFVLINYMTGIGPTGAIPNYEVLIYSYRKKQSKIYFNKIISKKLSGCKNVKEALLILRK